MQLNYAWLVLFIFNALRGGKISKNVLTKNNGIYTIMTGY